MTPESNPSEDHPLRRTTALRLPPTVVELLIAAEFGSGFLRDALDAATSAHSTPTRSG